MTKFLDWLDDRTGHRQWLQKLASHPIAGPPGWGRAVGAAFVLCLLLATTTGIALMTAYAPDPRSAWASVHFIQRVMPYGWLVRGVHRATADALVVLVGLHVIVLVLQGAYRKPREVAFWLALVLGFLVLLASVTGALLPWDQVGWWARTVEMNIVAMGPGGATIARFLQGGSDLGAIALTRAYTVHVFVAPAAFVLLLIALRGIERKHALASPSVRRYFPGQFARDLTLGAIAFAAIALVVQNRHGTPLGAPADPSSDYPARPEWFLMWMYELRHRMPRSLEFWGTTLVPAIFALFFAALPWIDRREASDTTGPPFRLRVLAPALGIVSIISVLSWSAMKRDRNDADLKEGLAKSAALAKIADSIAMDGVPPDGPLAMLDRDPELRGEKIFGQKCATCHLLGDLGDPKKANASALDGWTTEPWLMLQLHDPDGEMRFGRTPYKGNMPSMDAPQKSESDPKPLSKEEMTAAVAFLAAQADEPGDLIEPGAARSNPEIVVAGQNLVSERCTACHLYKGQGDDGGQGLAPELEHWGSLAWTKAQISNPGTKTTYREGALSVELKGHMPRFDEDLSPEDIDIVARWMRKRVRSSVPRP